MTTKITYEKVIEDLIKIVLNIEKRVDLIQRQIKLTNERIDVIK